jgi:hypothetical protein
MCELRSDVDLIVVVDREHVAKAREEVSKRAIELELFLHISVDPLVSSVDDFLSDVWSLEGGIIYGIANAYEILYDRTGGKLTRVLHERIEEIHRNYMYLGEVRQWVRAK